MNISNISNYTPTPLPTVFDPIAHTINWLRDDQSSLIWKINYVGMAAIMLLTNILLVGVGTWFLATQSLVLGAGVLAIAAIGLPAFAITLTVMGIVMWCRRASADRGVHEAFVHMKEAVGGEDAFNRLPMLDHNFRLLELRPDLLRAPVMRGMRGEETQVIVLRLQTNDPNGQPFDISLLQTPVDPYPLRHAQSTTEWTWYPGLAENDPRDIVATEVFGGRRIGPEALAAIRQIVVDRNHPRLRLA